MIAWIAWLACASAPLPQPAIEVALVDGDPARIVVASGVQIEVPGTHTAIALRKVEGGRTAPVAPLKRGVTYTLRSGAQTLDYSVPPLERPPVDCRLYPTLDVLPQNHLKLYVECTGPMRTPADLFERTALLSVTDGPIPNAFSEIPLWNPERTRLTLLFHPGRQKREIGFGEGLGSVLREGERYEFRMQGLVDALGRAVPDISKTFAVGPADHRSPEQARWTVEPPTTVESPLVVRFDEPLDAVLILSAFRATAGQQEIPIRIERGLNEQSLEMWPSERWPEGSVTLSRVGLVEDLAANGLTRAFEVQAGTPSAPLSPFAVTFAVHEETVAPGFGQ